MSKVLELKRARKELVDQLAPLAETDELNEEQEASFVELRAKADGLAKQIERVEYVESQRAVLERLDPVPSKPQPDEKKESVRAKKPGIENPGFENVGELVYCARFQPRDPRVLALQEMSTGESGGLAISVGAFAL